MRKVVLLAVATLPTSVFGQGLTIKSVTDTRFYGGLGTVVDIAAKFGGAKMHDIPATTYVSGHKLRTESGHTATIIDADAGRFISIDNDAKTYSSITFDEMAEAMRRAQESAKSKANEPASPKQASKDPKGDVNMKYKVDTDRPGQHERIAGYDAERMFLTITMEAEATPENGKTEQVGSVVLLVDQWISKDAPQSAAMAEFQRAYAQKAGQAFKSQTQALQAAFAGDPRLKGGLEAASKEMAKVAGTAMRSTIYFTLVPAGMQFDRKLALNDVSASNAKADKAQSDDKPKGGGFGGLVGKFKAAAEEANKNADNSNKKSSEPPKQGTLATVRDEVNSVVAGPVSADLFAPPAGYREVKR